MTKSQLHANATSFLLGGATVATLFGCIALAPHQEATQTTPATATTQAHSAQTTEDTTPITDRELAMLRAHAQLARLNAEFLDLLQAADLNENPGHLERWRKISTDLKVQVAHEAEMASKSLKLATDDTSEWRAKLLEDGRKALEASGSIQPELARKILTEVYKWPEANLYKLAAPK